MTPPINSVDLDALNGAAEFFENLATGTEPSSLVFSQAIRTAMAKETGAMVALEAMVAAVFAPNEPGSPSLAKAAEMAAQVFQNSTHEARP